VDDQVEEAAAFVDCEIVVLLVVFEIVVHVVVLHYVKVVEVERLDLALAVEMIVNEIDFLLKLAAVLPLEEMANHFQRIMANPVIGKGPP
jgi:hypothetical protein